ncbi:tRNA (adenosine(37)-N6)-threonylcarbamoyltransferase complex dimerization subunit type 1 TsaB [bacterium]|nr:tRNA (adenosine(37)-N6)-threonylcarbamoyltransferase complex dimerization subunit type 1 TsaB [bacterium]
MKRLIALATATRRGGAAIIEDGEPTAVRDISPSQTGGAALLAGAKNCLEETGLGWGDLTAVAVALGPGSFTGLRVGLATALGLVESLGLKLVGVGSLNCVARGANDELGEDGIICATLPAGEGLFYAQLFQYNNPLGGVSMVPVGELIERHPAQKYIGGALEAALGGLQGRLIPRHDWVSPVHLGVLAWERLMRGETDDPTKIAPLYVKRPAARPAFR